MRARYLEGEMFYKLDPMHSTREEVNDWLLWEEARLGGDEHHVVFVEGDGGVEHLHPGHMNL